jgi:hypothetical protein
MGIRHEDYVPDVPTVAAQHTAENVNLPDEDKIQLLEIVNLPEDGVHMPEEIPMNAFASQPSMFTQDTQQQSSTILMRMMKEVHLVYF